MQNTLEYVIGSRVRCAGEECGEVESMVVDPAADKLTHLVVRPDGGDGQARMVPVHIAIPGPEGVDLNCTRERFDEFELAMQTYVLPDIEQTGAVAATGATGATGTPGAAGPDPAPSWPLSGLVVTPSALTGFVPGVDPQLPATTVECVPDGEVSVRRGDRVHADGGEIGRVQGVVAVPPEGEVTHVLLDEGHLWGRKRVAIPIQDVTAIDADGVTVDLTKDEIKDLPPVAEQGPA